MPKIKTHSGASKRFSVTKNGRVKYAHQNRRHILTKRSTKRKRGLRQGAYVADCIENNIKKLIQLIGLVIIFQTNIKSVVNTIFGTIQTNAGKIR
ncbi:MAG: 50S ribosomal protein L35 [Eubacteriales bacterium]